MIKIHLINTFGRCRVRLLARREQGWTCLFRTLDGLAEADLDRRVTIRTRPLTGEPA